MNVLSKKANKEYQLVDIISKKACGNTSKSCNMLE